MAVLGAAESAFGEGGKGLEEVGHLGCEPASEGGALLSPSPKTQEAENDDDKNENETLTLAELVRYARPEFDAAGDLVAEHLAAARPRAKGIVVAAGEAAGEGVGTLAQDLRESYLEGKGAAAASASSSSPSSSSVGRDALAREFDEKLRALLAFAAGGEEE